MLRKCFSLIGMMKLRLSIVFKIGSTLKRGITMYLIIPKEIRKLERIFNPYIEGCHLVENAPEEAVEAFNKYFEWIKEAQGDYQ